jgi:hypothetical protein
MRRLEDCNAPTVLVLRRRGTRRLEARTTLMQAVSKGRER